MAELRDLLSQTAAKIAAYREQLPEATVFPTYSTDDLRAALGGALPDPPEDAGKVVEQLAKAAEPGLVASAGPRYFGFVGGSLDAKGIRR